jgi:hypothetical protein
MSTTTASTKLPAEDLPEKADDGKSTASATGDDEKGQVEPLEPSPGPDDFGPAPDGGLRAWLVAFGAACIFFSCLGFMNAFGVFQEYYMTHQLSHKTADDIAWIGSVAAFVQFATGAIAGGLFDRYGPWVREKWNYRSIGCHPLEVKRPNKYRV